MSCLRSLRLGLTRLRPTQSSTPLLLQRNLLAALTHRHASSLPIDPPKISAQSTPLPPKLFPNGAAASSATNGNGTKIDNTVRNLLWTILGILTLNLLTTTAPFRAVLLELEAMRQEVRTQTVKQRMMLQQNVDQLVAIKGELENDRIALETVKNELIKALSSAVRGEPVDDNTKERLSRWVEVNSTRPNASNNNQSR